jgi:hypothetical protein
VTRSAGLWLAAGLVVAVAAFFGGRALHGDGSSAGAFDFDAPAYGSVKSIAGLSRGGFSGFGDTPGLDGRTVIAGRIVSAAADSITVESSQGVRSTLRISSAAPLRRLDTSGREALRPGVTVVVRRSDSGEPAAVLIVAEP